MESNQCACGCGETIAPSRKFVRGHNWAARRFGNYVVEDRGFSSPCWIWQGVVDTNGYARVQYRGKRWRVHRAFYTEMVGEIPRDFTLDHLCCVRLCVNPAHLEPVTARENSQRMHRAASSHNRGKYWSESEVAKVHRLTDAGLSTREIAEMLGRTQSSVAVKRCETKIR